MESRARWRPDGHGVRRAGYCASLLCFALHFCQPVLAEHGQVSGQSSTYGQFPKSQDPFRFLPCTPNTVPPALEDKDAERTWAKLFDVNPSAWSWGPVASDHKSHDPYAGRGIYLCGYIDVPLDYTNKSDPRIARLGVTKFQVSGLARRNSHSSSPSAGQKSSRTIIINPGGPGQSGTEQVWNEGKELTRRLSDGQFDVLGWDPRGVNISLPAITCYPFDADRDRWGLITGLYRKTLSRAKAQLNLADAMNKATYRSCWEKYGDIPRFLTTSFTVRDLEEIRRALGEDEVTGIFKSYGTDIAQTYANMYPARAGRMVLDGVVYSRTERTQTGFEKTLFNNPIDLWRDGVLGECIDAGPDYCALAKPVKGVSVTLDQLEERMDVLLSSLIDSPVLAYSDDSGPSIVTYSAIVNSIYASLYDPAGWPAMAEMLLGLEAENSTLAVPFLDDFIWMYNPAAPMKQLSGLELTPLVSCGDAYDDPSPGLDRWDSLWENLVKKSWLSGDTILYEALPCEHFVDYWPKPAEVYRGDFNNTLKNPVLLVSSKYDPATPIQDARDLLKEMGFENARLVAHHGYGHTSAVNPSACTWAAERALILNGRVPDTLETNCYPDQRPYRIDDA